MPKINMKQIINFSAKLVKVLEQSILMIQKLLLNIQTMWPIFFFKILIQIKNAKY